MRMSKKQEYQAALNSLHFARETVQSIATGPDYPEKQEDLKYWRDSIQYHERDIRALQAAPLLKQFVRAAGR